MTFSSVVESCNRAVGFGLSESALNGGELGRVSVRSWIDIGLGPDVPDSTVYRREDFELDKAAIALWSR
ncbi:hypothetical protein TNCV_3623621 [Trichonephila clavipes]|nr:hypothetical protein TNCV_3623621 [Trichonephila clavipes]